MLTNTLKIYDFNSDKFKVYAVYDIKSALSKKHQLAQKVLDMNMNDKELNELEIYLGK